MPLSPQDIIQKVFREAFRGYNQSDVDLFLDEVAEEFARLVEENQRAKTRVAALQQEVARLRSGRPAEPGDPEAPARTAEPRRVDVEVRARLRRILEEQIRQIDAADSAAQTTAERIAREVGRTQSPDREAPAREVAREAAGGAEERPAGSRRDFWKE